MTEEDDRLPVKGLAYALRVRPREIRRWMREGENVGPARELRPRKTQNGLEAVFPVAAVDHWVLNELDLEDEFERQLATNWLKWREGERWVLGDD